MKFGVFRVFRVVFGMIHEIPVEIDILFGHPTQPGEPVAVQGMDQDYAYV